MKTLVNKPNAMIQAGQKLSAAQAKIIYSILSKFKYITSESYDIDEITKEVYIVPFSEIVANLKTSKGGRVYDLMRVQASTLVQQFLSVKTYKNNKEKMVYYNLVSSVEVSEGISEIKATLNRDVIPILANMVKEGYTQIAFRDIFKMKSSYSIRIYELLEQNRNSPQVKKKGYYEILIEDLRFLLGIDKNLYPRWDRFKDRILLAPQKEIVEKTPLRFDMEYVKQSRKIVGVRFTNITMVDLVDGKNIEQIRLDLGEQTSLFPKTEIFTPPNPLLSSLQPKSREELEKQHTKEYIEYYYNKAKKYESENRITGDFASCLYTFLKNDKDEFYSMKERAKIERAKIQEAEKLKELEEKRAKLKEEERQRLIDDNLKTLKNKFSTLSTIEQDNYKKLVAQENDFLATVGGSTFENMILEKFGRENNLWKVD